jgi:hypothetical protein
MLRSCLILCALLLCSPARAVELRTTIYDQAAGAVGLDPLLLYALTVVESGRVEQGRVTPTPLVIASAQGVVWSDDEAAAKAALDLAPHSTDIGIAQVNRRWHGDRVADVGDLLDPAINLAVAAEILRTAIDSAPDDFELGIGRYHNWNEALARAYGRRVLQVYAKLLAVRE